MRKLLLACLSLILSGSWAMAQTPDGYPPYQPGSLQKLPHGGWQSSPDNWQPPPDGSWGPTPPPRKTLRTFFHLPALPLTPACGRNKTFEDFGSNGWKADCRFIFGSSWEFFSEPCPVYPGHPWHRCIEGLGPMQKGHQPRQPFKAGTFDRYTPPNPPPPCSCRDW